jgi:flagellin
MQQVQDQLSRMKGLAIKAGGVVSSGDVSNMQTEFDALQSEITRITSKSTAAGQFNGLYLFRGGNGVATDVGDVVEAGDVTLQVGPDTDQTVDVSTADLSVENVDVIGTVDSFEYDEQHNVTSDTHTDVTWSEVIDSANGIDVDSADAIGKIDAALDFVSNSRAQMASEQRRLEDTHSGLISYESNLRASESNVRDQDMAKAMTELTKHLILSSVGNAMTGQANKLPADAILQLLG